jgi:hypothetical protein
VLLLALALLASTELISGGRPRLWVEADGDPVAAAAAAILRREVVLLAGVALPEVGKGPALRFERTSEPGYAIAGRGAGAVISGRDLVRAVYDLLDEWAAAPDRATLVLPERAWRRERTLFVDPPALDPRFPAEGWAARGLAAYDPSVAAACARYGLLYRVASTSFDDFLPPARFDAHPEWFALRGGAREPRGNFCLSNAEARAACVEAAAAWLDARPEVEALGLWPEATVAWCECEPCRALGPAEAYALLWREAAARAGPRRIEILAAGPTLHPPRGRADVRVRLAPGRDGCGLHGAADLSCPKNVAEVAAAWRDAGAEVWLEMDAAPLSWLGMPWPCEEAVRANARAFPRAVLRSGTLALARVWRDPDASPAGVAPAAHSWGDPRDAARLVSPEAPGPAGLVATAERLLLAAEAPSRPADIRREAAAGALAAYGDALAALDPAASRVYARHRAAEFRRVIGELLPDGAERAFGPARLRETVDGLALETDLLRLDIDRREARVVGLRRRAGDRWSDDLGGGAGVFFAPATLDGPLDRLDARVRLLLPEAGVVRIEFEGVKWRSALEIAGGSPIVRQEVRLEGGGGAAAGSRFGAAAFDRWLCPAYATEGPLPGKDRRHAFALPPRTLLYARAGERGIGLAARLPQGGYASIEEGPAPLLAVAGRAAVLRVEWIVFAGSGELGR